MLPVFRACLFGVTCIMFIEKRSRCYSQVIFCCLILKGFKHTLVRSPCQEINPILRALPKLFMTFFLNDL